MLLMRILFLLLVLLLWKLLKYLGVLMKPPSPRPGEQAPNASHAALDPHSATNTGTLTPHTCMSHPRMQHAHLGRRKSAITPANLQDFGRATTTPSSSKRAKRMSHQQPHGEEQRMPKLYKVYRVAVTSIKEYGAFVEMEGFQRKALLHISQMSNTRVNDPTEVVSVGDPLFAKVIDIADDGKIAVSIKTVRQSDGTDTDSTNIVPEQDKLRKSAVTETEKPRLQLGAVLNTVCSKCGTQGHFAKDCFSRGKQYAVVEADPELEALEEAQEAKQRSRKARRASPSSSDSESDDGSPSEKRAKRERKHKKHKKHKEKKHKKEKKREKKHKKHKKHKREDNGHHRERRGSRDDRSSGRSHRHHDGEDDHSRRRSRRSRSRERHR